jgi:hypothetical protein
VLRPLGQKRCTRHEQQRHERSGEPKAGHIDTSLPPTLARCEHQRTYILLTRDRLQEFRVVLHVVERRDPKLVREIARVAVTFQTETACIIQV